MELSKTSNIEMVKEQQQQQPEPEPPVLDFITLGMFIIDQIHFQDGTSVDNITGGAGSYAVLGARVLSPPPRSKLIGWIVDKGNDFPEEMVEEIRRLKTNLLLRDTPWRKTTRGWNGYGEDDARGFKYLTPKLRLKPFDYISTKPSLGITRSIHLISSPQRAMECINDYLSFASENLDYRKARGRNLPLFLWEPVPDLCTPDNASAMLNVLPHVDAMSPNHLELMRFYHQEELAEYHKEVEGKIVEDGGDSSDEATEEKALLEYIVKSLIYRLAKPTMVVRCSSWGCLISRWDPQHGTVVATWLPAFYEPVEGLGNHPKVVDPTGGGNAFIGGLAINLVQQQKEQEERGIEHPVLDFVQAAAHGNITASFAIEQVGVPKMEVTADGGEMWNGEVVETRLRRYLERCGL